MERKWRTSQTYIISAIVAVLFLYIIVDIFAAKPKMRSDIQEVKNQYVELSTFLDKKIPEIDSTFKEQATQIKIQEQQISELEKTLSVITDK